MRTFHWSAPIFLGAGALVLALFASAPPSLGAGKIKSSATPQPAASATDPLAESLAELRSRLDPSDRRMATRALDLALTEIADGSTLVWKRPASDLVGRISPVSAFRDDQGRICRRIVYSLALGNLERRAEGIACRQEDGSWSLDG